MKGKLVFSSDERSQHCSKTPIIDLTVGVMSGNLVTNRIKVKGIKHDTPSFIPVVTISLNLKRIVLGEQLEKEKLVNIVLVATFCSSMLLTFSRRM